MNHWLHKPFVKLIIPLILGIWVSQYSLVIQILSLIGVLFTLSFFISYISKPSQKSSIRGAGIIMACFIFGVTIYTLNDQRRLSKHYSNCDNIYQFEGEIYSIRQKGKFLQIELQLNKIIVDSTHWINSHGRILIYLSNKKNNYYPADLLLVKGCPKKLQAPKNPHSFDFKTYAFHKHIHASLFVNQNNLIKIGHRFFSLKRVAYQAQHYFIEILKKIIPSEREHNISSALILGHKDNLDSTILDTFKNTGSMHVLAVSGLHVGIIYLIISTLLSWLPVQNSFQKLIKALIITIGIWSFALISGFGSAVIRASFMFSLISIGLSFYRRSNIFNTLSFSAFVMLSYDPYYLRDIGFQLSYCAMFSIVYFYPKLVRLWTPSTITLNYLWQMSIVGLSAQIFTLPLATYYFNQYALSSLLSNVIVLPFAFLVLTFGWLAIGLSYILPIWSFFIGRILQGLLGLMYEMLSALSWNKGLLLDQIFISDLELFVWIIMLILVVISIHYKSRLIVMIILPLMILIQVSMAHRSFINNQSIRLSSYSYKFPLIELQCANQVYLFQSPEISDNKLHHLTHGNHLKCGVNQLSKIQPNIPIELKIKNKRLKIIIINDDLEIPTEVDIAIIAQGNQQNIFNIFNCLDARKVFFKPNEKSRTIKYEVDKIAKQNSVPLEWIGTEYWSQNVTRFLD